LFCKLTIRLQIDERIAIYGKLYQFHSFNQQSERHIPPIQVKIAGAISLHLRLCKTEVTKLILFDPSHPRANRHFL
jgi:hypothetical protein